MSALVLLKIALVLAALLSFGAGSMLLGVAARAVADWRRLPARKASLTSIIVMAGVLASLGAGFMILAVSLFWGVA